MSRPRRHRAERRIRDRCDPGSIKVVFGSIRPANTIMQIVRFTDPDGLAEIEADAVVES
jgi:hypothetical protein